MLPSSPSNCSRISFFNIVDQLDSSHPLTALGRSPDRASLEESLQSNYSDNGIGQRRTYVKEVRELRLCCRHFRHVKRRRKANKALRRLRTIAGILLRELARKLPQEIVSLHQAQFDLYRRVLSQKKKDKNKIYSLHEPDVYCAGKGKDHKPCEYGRKASVVSTKDHQVIVGVVSHDEHVHDSRTLADAIKEAESHRDNAIEMAVVDRGYRGCKSRVSCEVLLPGPPLKRDTAKERNKKRVLCRQRAAIEPIIGHLKHDYRLSRNWLKGSSGDSINLLLLACAWNLRKWMTALFLSQDSDGVTCLVLIMVERYMYGTDSVKRQ